MNFAIVDIETNGGDKITEICILVFDGEKIVKEFNTLINPGTSIPGYITQLTGITNFMVKDSPRFEEVAKEIYQITEDCVFVAHNVNFDYGIISKEYKSLGLNFRRRKLCTVRLSRKLLPNKKSYSLGRLCISEDIEIKDRHRARGDAEATVILFKRLHKIDSIDNYKTINSFLNPRSREGTLPPLLSKEVFENLSAKHGVYFFWNKHKEIIYVGKANNIKKRVLSHFYDKKKKEIKMCLETANITFQETGNELIALLLESSEIKTNYPKYNKAQRRTNASYGLFSYEDRKGVLHLAWNKIKLINKPLVKFYSVTEARTYLEKICQEFELCPKYCHLQTNVSNCFHFQIKECKGICRNEESIIEYNKRVKQFLNTIEFKAKNFIIEEKGIKKNQISYVLVQEGLYKGFGYLPRRTKRYNIEDYLENLILQKDNKETKRILRSYLNNDNEVKRILLT